MHDELGLGGVVWTFLQIVLVLAVALALFVLFDSVRRSRRSGERFQDRMLKFGIFQVAFLLLLLLSQFRVLAPWLPIISAVLIPFSLGQSVAYLLRVVYPKPSSEAFDD